MLRVTNEDFLRACFGPEYGRAHVCAFACDPNTAGPLWAGWRWADRETESFRAQNSYFTISLFRDEPGTGRARRVKGLFKSTHVIVVDDVGTKVDGDAAARLPEPSYKLETSPGNFQWGYILDNPETDAGRVNALLDGMVAKGLCADGKDPGMKGVTRYVRLPEGRNTKAKYGPGGFACVMHEWHPGRCFTLEALAAPWSIAMPAPGASPAARHSPKASAAVSPDADPIYAHLLRWGMADRTRAADGVGRLCECPWIDEHTDRADSGTAYYIGGGFKCHHGHCADKNRDDLLAWVNARLVIEQGHGLAALEFKGVDRPVLDAFVHVLASGRVPSQADLEALAAVPNVRDVDGMLRAVRAVLGVEAGPIRRDLRRIRKRWHREAWRAAVVPKRAARTKRLPAPADAPAPVPLAEAQAQMKAALDAAWAEADAADAGNAPLRRGRGRGRLRAC